jgi:hypothetical protein
VGLDDNATVLLVNVTCMADEAITVGFEERITVGLEDRIVVGLDDRVTVLPFGEMDITTALMVEVTALAVPVTAAITGAEVEPFEIGAPTCVR